MDKSESTTRINNKDKVIFQRSAAFPNVIGEYCSDKIKIPESSYTLDVYGPEYIVKSYSNIFIRDSYKLIAYLYTSRSGGNGSVYAVDKELLPKNIDQYTIQEDLFLSPPKPKESLSSFMEAIDGDKSALSYLQAAVSYHELREYGASWHGVNWGRDVILPVYENQINESDITDHEWEMLRHEPETINPHFYYDENKNPTIVFYTINDIYTYTLNEYIHTFDKASYKLEVVLNTIAQSQEGMGIIF